MDEKPSTSKRIGSFVSATFMTQLITAIASIITRRLLGPLQMGMWSLIQVILSYADYSTLGTTNAIAREMPFYSGAGDWARVESIKNNVFSFCLLTGCLTAVLIGLYPLMTPQKLSQEMFYALLFAAALILLQRFNNLLIEVLRAEQKFVFLSRQMVVSSFVNVLLIALLAYPFQLFGFVWAMALSFIFNIAYIIRFNKIAFRWLWQWHEIRSLIAYGLPLMILAFLNAILLSVDKLMIAKYLSLEDLGLYSIAGMALSYLHSIPNSIGIVVMPHFQERYGALQEIAELKGYLNRWSHAYSDLMPLLIGYAWLIGPLFIQWLLPKFGLGIRAMQYLSLSIFFIALANPFGHFLVAIRKHLTLIPITMMTLALTVLLNLYAIHKGYGISGVALVTTFTAFCQFAAIYFTAGRLIYSNRELVTHFRESMVKFLYGVFILLIAERLKLRIPDFALLGIQVLFFTLLAIPLITGLNRRTEAVKKAWLFIRRRFGKENGKL